MVHAHGECSRVAEGRIVLTRLIWTQPVTLEYGARPTGPGADVESVVGPETDLMLAPPVTTLSPRQAGASLGTGSATPRPAHCR